MFFVFVNEISCKALLVEINICIAIVQFPLVDKKKPLYVV